ncbi:ribonuclease HII, partial [Pseudomonas sp. MPR-R1B]
LHRRSFAPVAAAYRSRETLLV